MLAMSGRKDLDVTHWVGAVKRDAEGSFVQLQDKILRRILSLVGTQCGKIRAGLFIISKQETESLDR